MFSLVSVWALASIGYQYLYLVSVSVFYRYWYQYPYGSSAWNQYRYECSVWYHYRYGAIRLTVENLLISLKAAIVSFKTSKIRDSYSESWQFFFFFLSATNILSKYCLIAKMNGHFIPARMKWSNPCRPEQNGPFHSSNIEQAIRIEQVHSSRNGMDHYIPAKMEWTISFWPEWNGSFHSGRNEMFTPWTQIRNMGPAWMTWRQ